MEASEAAQHTMGERRPYGELYYKNEMSTIWINECDKMINGTES